MKRVRPRRAVGPALTIVLVAALAAACNPGGGAPTAPTTAPPAGSVAPASAVPSSGAPGYDY